jgi:hypothetical protein
MIGNRLRTALGLQAFTLPSPPSVLFVAFVAFWAPKSVRIGFPGASFGGRGTRGSILGDQGDWSQGGTRKIASEVEPVEPDMVMARWAG